MAPGEVIEGSLTLLRGRQGELFPTHGDYRVLVEASWTVQNLDRFAVGATRVTVAPAVDAAHADVARKLLATSDTLLVLVFGGDHLTEGIAAIHAALAMLCCGRTSLSSKPSAWASRSGSGRQTCWPPPN